MRFVVPGLVLALQTAASNNGEGFRVVIDSKLGKGKNAKFIKEVRNAINKLTLRNDLLP